MQRSVLFAVLVHFVVCLVTSQSYEFFLSVMLTELNEQNSILEFMQHYIEEGVDHVFIFDDGSTDETLLRLKCIDDRFYSIYIKSDLYFGNETHLPKQIQMEHYDRLYNAGGVKWRSKWVIKADADEYITSRSAPHLTIRQIIEEHYDKSDCDAIIVPWLLFSWGTQLHSPINSARQSLFHRWGYDQKYAVETNSTKFRNRYESVENKVIFRTEKVSSSYSLHAVQFSNSSQGGTVCVPYQGQHLQCARAAWWDRATRRWLTGGFVGMLHVVNDPRGPHSRSYFDHTQNGVFLNTEGRPLGHLQRWCPPVLAFRTNESPLWTRIAEDDVDHLLLATFHYRVRSWDDWNRKIDPTRRRSEMYIGHEAEANRMDVFDDFMVSKRLPARIGNSYTAAARHMLRDCPKEFIS